MSALVESFDDTSDVALQFEWPRELSVPDMLGMVRLMNTVAVNETTLGFFEPIDDAQGLQLMQGLQAELSKGACHLLIARSDDQQIIGMIVLAPQALPARRHIAELRRCVIDPAFRGRFLLRGWACILHKAEQLRCDMLILDVRGDGKAEQLWRRLGFVEYGRLDDYARVRGRVITGYFMRAYLRDIRQHRERQGTYWHRQERIA